MGSGVRGAGGCVPGGPAAASVASSVAVIAEPGVRVRPARGVLPDGADWQAARNIARGRRAVNSRFVIETNRSSALRLIRPLSGLVSLIWVFLVLHEAPGPLANGGRAVLALANTASAVQGAQGRAAPRPGT